LKARGPKLTNPRRVASDYLLSGLLKCGVCGKAMTGHSAKSGQFFYYRCNNATKRGPEECSGQWLPRKKLEGFVIDKVKNYVLSDDNLAELVRITQEEIGSNTGSLKEQLEILSGQITDIEDRLEHLYDALEKGSFSHEELGPRIKKLQSRKAELESNRQQVNYSIQSRFLQVPDIEKVQEYVSDLKSLLVSSPIVEQKGFLKAFVKNIVVNSKEMTINYTLPIATSGGTTDVTGVLPFISRGEPSEDRTRDHLIKSCMPWRTLASETVQ
jgi:hypothetical protein